MSRWRLTVLILALLGLGFALLMIGFGIGAVLARVTFPFSILTAAGLFFLPVWGCLCMACPLGRGLMMRAGWGGSSLAASLALGLLPLLPLVRIPYIGAFFVIIYICLGMGLVIASHFGSNESWNLIPLLEEGTK